jgi:glycosyltransferase involved in cell wall biosynthesis
MKKEPLVSIALCTYNGEKHLEKQLDSLLTQTYSNLEVVIVDDCSTDNTYSIASSYAEKDSRIKCFKNAANLGFNKNFERAISLTTGEYIAISDQDDIWLPHKIESLLSNIESKWLIFSNSSFINDDNETLEGKMLYGFNPTEHNYKCMLLANFVTGHTVLFKKDFINYFLPFPQNGFYDWWIGLIALYHEEIVFFDEILTKHRLHNHSVMQERLRSGGEELEEVRTIDQVISAFSEYKHLKNDDRLFVTSLRDAYKADLYKQNIIPLIKTILKHYNHLFCYHKKRTGFSLLNFALKYASKVKEHA